MVRGIPRTALGPHARRRLWIGGSAALWLVMASVAGGTSHGWGWAAHRRVAEAATRSMPHPLREFFDFWGPRIQEMALEPDARMRREDAEEGPRHYVNLDSLVRDPTDLSALPRDLETARRKFGEARMAKEGILPWWIAESELRLSRAMRRGNPSQIAREAAHLSHYVADLHQPLHLTRNHDGQRTGQRGVHAAYERFMVEASPDRYGPLRAGEQPLRVIESPAAWAIARAEEVYPGAAEILAAHRVARAASVREGVDLHAELEERLGDATRRLLDWAAQGTAQLWISAWIKAGRPDPADWRSGAGPGPVGKARRR